MLHCQYARSGHIPRALTRVSLSSTLHPSAGVGTPDMALTLAALPSFGIGRLDSQLSTPAARGSSCGCAFSNIQCYTTT